MATWAKIKFFWDQMMGFSSSGLTASATAPGYDVGSIINMLETDAWKGGGAYAHYINYDAGTPKPCDYLAIIGHNLKTIGATIQLQYSDNNFVNVNGAFPAETPSSDGAYLKEFSGADTHRWWRLEISGPVSAAPYMALCVWGLKTELDYASSPFDPHGQNSEANVNVSQGGYVTGVHTLYTEREMTLRFEDADAVLYAKIKNWWEGSGLRNFFVAWESANNPTDVWLMRPEPKFNHPLKNGGAYRDITISLRGRKE